ncbi:MAG: hypothetical protein HOV92_00550 [Streptomyces sp.]|nr:hypothetical protein [Streptomyces sp.]
MADTVTLRLKTDVDNTVAAELTPRLRSTIHEALASARATGAEDEAGAAAYAVMVEILRVRQATPAETAIDRVRALHRNECESCAECTHEFAVPWPCPTIRALDGQEQP